MVGIRGVREGGEETGGGRWTGRQAGEGGRGMGGGGRRIVERRRRMMGGRVLEDEGPAGLGKEAGSKGEMVGERGRSGEVGGGVAVRRRRKGEDGVRLVRREDERVLRKKRMGRKERRRARTERNGMVCRMAMRVPECRLHRVCMDGRPCSWEGLR